jgi:alpha-galactosidase
MNAYQSRTLERARGEGTPNSADEVNFVVGRTPHRLLRPRMSLSFLLIAIAATAAAACGADSSHGTTGAPVQGPLGPCQKCPCALAPGNPPPIDSSPGNKPASPPPAAAPPMGWNTWNRFMCDISESLIRETADAMVSSGLRDAGYQYIVIDDCWQKERDAAGVIVADRATFPSGIHALADYVHGCGLKLGIYTDAGSATCQGRPGTLGHERQDAATYAEWGVDFVKEDWCAAGELSARVQYPLMRDAIRETGREMVFSICNWGLDSPWEWGPSSGNMWRTTGDLANDNSWNGMLGNFRASAQYAAVAQAGHWNDPDILEVGNGSLTEVEDRTHFSLWAISAAPLMAGNDLRAMSAATRETLTNAEVIAIDQDPAGIQAVKVRDDGNGLEVWSRPLHDAGARAVLLLNTSSATIHAPLRWSEIGLAAGDAQVRDVWAHADLGKLTQHEVDVPAHGVAMFTIRGSDPVVPSGADWKLGALAWTHAASGAFVERDKTSGGNPLILGGVTYESGLGVHAESDVRYSLAGHCQSFTSDIGLDDSADKDVGSVVFQVWGDGKKLADSGVLTGGAATHLLNTDVTGVKELRLVVTGAGDKVDGDVADWAGAELHCK